MGTNSTRKTPTTVKTARAIGTAALVAAKAESERDFMRAVIEYAQLRGFLVFHDHDSRRNPAGLPDLILLRAGRLIFAELKTQRGRVRSEQRRWLDGLQECNHLEVYLWRPADFQQIVEVLK